MTKKIKAIIRQVQAKQHAIGALTIMMFFLFVAFSSMLVIIPEKAEAAYTDYTYNKLIRINQDYIDGALTNFPVWVYSVSANFSDNMKSDASDLAFYDETNSTRFNHEIEVWDDATGELGVWVNVTSISDSSPTDFYLYYGWAATPDSVNYNPTDVWDGNFVGVWHMNGSGAESAVAYDSSGNKNHGIIENGSATSNESGIVGYALDFDGHTWINLNAHIANVTSLSSGTVSIWHNKTVFREGALFTVSDTTDGQVNHMLYHINTDGTADFDFRQYSAGANHYLLRMYSGSVGISTFGGDFFFAYADNASGNHGFWNDTHVQNYATIGDNDTDVFLDDISTEDVFLIGARYEYLAAGTDEEFEGTIDEFRFSNIRRTKAWINATYDNINASDFLTIGESESGAEVSVFSIKGMDGNDRITWAGSEGDTVWSNASYPGGTLEVNMSVNSSDNVTEIRVYCDDIDASLTASNITVYVSRLNDTNWAVVEDNSNGFGNGIFPDAGGNISINTTTWGAGSGTNPFPIDNPSGWKNTSIYCRFTLSLPSGISANTYTTDTWKVHIGKT